MRLLLGLAWRNLKGAGLRTGLNVAVLSLTFFAIVASLGLLEGMNEQTSRAMVEAESGGGQFWHPGYDPADPLALEQARGSLPPGLARLVDAGSATPILAVPGTMYAGGRLRAVVLRGIPPGQRVLALPTAGLDLFAEEIPILLGSRMAESAGLEEGDTATLQWRDASGTIDAREARVVRLMSTPVQGVDVNQVWLPIARLREMTGLDGAVTIVVVAPGTAVVGHEGEPWRFQSQDALLADIRQLVQSKAVGATIVYALLIFLSMLAIFDTQVLALFRRRKEIGTMLALGMTRERISGLFTLEGALHGVLAVAAGLVYGAPVLWWFSRTGWKLSAMADRYGFALGDTLYPSYSPGLVLGTIGVLLVITTVVSYLPTRRIASLSPTEALRGRRP